MILTPLFFNICLGIPFQGIIFVNWEDDLHSREEADYVWSLADWPQNGWACAESTPVPTYVSPGVGLGSKKGAHLGLGGATTGTRSLAGRGRDLAGGGAFGIPGSAGMGVTGLGWEVSEEFEELVEQPATLENVRGRAFSRHPSMPYFLVGSSNTHIYLWEVSLFFIDMFIQMFSFIDFVASTE